MDPKLRRIADYLLAHRERQQIDPLDIAPGLLPHFFILEARTPPERGTQDASKTASSEMPLISLHIRLAGTALDAAFGRSVRGHYLEEFLHGPRSIEVLQGFRNCHSHQQPLWMRQVVRIGDKVPRFVEGIAVPVVPDLIYGGLILGETSPQDELIGFNSRPL